MRRKYSWQIILIAIAVIGLYEGTGFLFGIDWMKIMTFTKTGFTISFFGVLACVMTGFIIGLLIHRIHTKKNQG